MPALLAVAVVAAGCSGDDRPSVDVSGSSTVEPISVRVAELFEDVEDDILVNVDGPGTGDGFRLFCQGQTDISDASRRIKDEEAEDCAANGIEFIEIEVAKDGVSVLTSPANEVDCLSFADLYGLMGPESDDVDHWSDAAAIARQLGSTTELPDARLDISAPGAESGTYDSFVELALEGPYEERVASGEVAPDLDPPIRRFPGQSDDNIIIQGIEGSERSFGWVGFPFAQEAGDAVKQLAVAAEPDGECVEPSRATIASGEYPLGRPLFIYVSLTSLDEEPGVEAYVDFYLGDGYGAVSEVGYVDLTDERLDEVRRRWEARTTGIEP